MKDSVQASTDMQQDFVGSVIPIGLVPDLPSVPSGAPFGLTLNLSAPPISPSTVTVYIMPANSAQSVTAHVVVTEEVHFSNPANTLDVHTQTTMQAAMSASSVSLPLVMPILAHQQQQHLRLPAPTVTAPSQYTVTVVGHNQNNVPTNGVSTTITVHP